MKKFTKTHEWVIKDGDVWKVGISDYAQKTLGDIVYVGAPALDAKVEAKENFAVIESVKAASDVYAPISGIVVSVNEALIDQPELINQDPYGAGWILTLKQNEGEVDLSPLLTEEEYLSYIEKEL